MVGGVGDLVGLEAEPFDNLEDSCEVALFLGFRIGIIVAQVALAVVVAGEPEVDSDGFAVTDVEVAIWLSTPIDQRYIPPKARQTQTNLRWKPGENFPPGSF